MEYQTAQLRVKKNCIIAEGSDGHIFWATPSRARLLIDAGAAELVNAGASEAPLVGPGEAPAAGPSELKDLAGKKSSAAAQDGRSTDSASSSAPGPAALSSASAGDLVSPERKRPQLHRRASAPKRSG